MHQTEIQPDAGLADCRNQMIRGRILRRRIVAVAAVGVVAALSLTLAPSVLRRVAVAVVPDDDQRSLRTVSVVRPKPVEDVTLSLPANIDAFQTTLVYSRVNGYLLKWHVDIGERVKKGQPLADIDTPEVDQELKQARANLVQGQADLDTAIAEQQEAQAALKQADAEIARAKANLEYARVVHQRNEQLGVQHAVANQDVDESRREKEMRQADLDLADALLKTRQSMVATSTAKIKSREAMIKSLEASVRRLEEMETLKTILAPFDGIVTRRRAEIGMLVNSGSASTTQELYAVAQADTLRIRINVPQSQAMAVQMGQNALVAVPEYPDRQFTAKVARTAQAIDPASRTLMVELELPNADHALLPGTFAQVTLTMRRPVSAWAIPAIVLLSRSDGLKVAVVDRKNVVRLRKVKLGRDYGRSVEVLSGIQGTEALVVNPPDDLSDNEQVMIAESPAGSASQGGAAVAAHEPKPRS